MSKSEYSNILTNKNIINKNKIKQNVFSKLIGKKPENVLQDIDYKLLQKYPEYSKRLIIDLVNFANIDNNISDEEITFIKSVAKELNITDIDFDKEFEKLKAQQ